MSDIYPKELSLVPDESGLHARFLDPNLTLKGGVITASIFDKRDDSDFPIVNFPVLTGNIPKKCSYGVFVGEAVRYARACTYYDDFEERTLLLVNKLKKQYYLSKLLKKAWLKFCDTHILLIQKYGTKAYHMHNKWA